MQPRSFPSFNTPRGLTPLGITRLAASLLVLASVSRIAPARPQEPARASGAQRGERLGVEHGVLAELARSGADSVYVGIVLRTAPRAIARDRALRELDVRERQELLLARFSPGEFALAYRYSQVPAVTGRVNAAGLARLQRDPAVFAVGLDVRGGFASPGAPGPAPALDGSVPFIGADVVHAMGVTGQGATVCVLDSGIDTDHPDLQDNVAAGAYHFLNQGANVGPGAEDQHGHGTNVCGIVTSGGVVAPVGVAPDADILAIKVLDAGGGGWLSDWTAGVDHAVAHAGDYDNLCALSMSLVSFTLSGNCPCDLDNSFFIALGAALQAARDDGIPTFAASGNNFSCTEMSAPACTAAAIAVASVFHAGNPDGIVPEANRTACNELAAPGFQILSAGLGGGTSNFTGTSMATPHCSGLAALIAQRRMDAGVPNLAPDVLVQVLKDTAVLTSDPCGTSPTPLRIDAQGAILEAGPAPIGSSFCSPAVPNSSSQSAVLRALGSDRVDRADVTLFASRLPANQFGYFLAGRTPGLTTPPGSAGNLCLAGNIGRYVGDVLNSGAAGAFALTIGLGAIPVNPPAGVQPGESWYFQSWFRDSPSSNFTSGVRVDFQ